MVIPFAFIGWWGTLAFVVIVILLFFVWRLLERAARRNSDT